MRRVKPSGPSGESSRGANVSIAFRSAPAQNAIAARAGQDEHARVVVGLEALVALLVSSSAVGPSTALRRSGRSIVRTAAAPTRS